MAEPIARKKRVSGAPASRARKSVRMQSPLTNTPAPAGTICHACNSLPVGSVELTALMIVLVFSLSAVLLTSVAALRIQSDKVADLEAEVTAVSINE